MQKRLESIAGVKWRVVQSAEGIERTARVGRFVVRVHTREGEYYGWSVSKGHRELSAGGGFGLDEIAALAVERARFLKSVTPTAYQ